MTPGLWHNAWKIHILPIAWMPTFSMLSYTTPKQCTKTIQQFQYLISTKQNSKTFSTQRWNVHYNTTTYKWWSSLLICSTCQKHTAWPPTRLETSSTLWCHHMWFCRLPAAVAAPMNSMPPMSALTPDHNSQPIHYQTIHPMITAPHAETHRTPEETYCMMQYSPYVTSSTKKTYYDCPS